MAMQSTTQFKPGDIVLLVFPFSHQAGSKQRPALVVYDALDAWRAAGLLTPSTVRVHKLATIEKSMVKRKLGEIEKPDRARFSEIFRRTYCETWVFE